ncbi:L-lactate dehydrogenase complex protein LldG [Paenibacillus sp. OV219]|nr:L-lactate dehydrogenase complex protein LldG [Paenibacillus sp. OV219]
METGGTGIMANKEAHQQWLAEQTAKSKEKQVSFINGISSKLGRARSVGAPAHPFRGAPEFWREFEWPVDERAEKFMENFRAVGGHSLRLGSMVEAKQFVVDKAAELSAKYIIRQNQPELAEMDLESALPEAKVSVWNSDPEEQWKARAAEADFGVVVVDYAAAYTGSMTVLSSKDKGRSVSLLPTVLIAIIPIERLRTRLGEVLVEFDQAGREQLPAGIHFISGPSRSADIENDLTIGVHGPGVVYAIIVG